MFSMLEGIIQNLNEKGFLNNKIDNGETIYYLKAPCCFNIVAEIVDKLKTTYIPTEEIGGILWALPIVKSGEIVYRIDRVDFIRNSIEDSPREDKRNKSNAYLPDGIEIGQAYSLMKDSEYFPVHFHTHPVLSDESNLLNELTNAMQQTETSTQDIKVSKMYKRYGDFQILFPNALIVGGKLDKDLFIGFYNGFIAPVTFDASKQNIQKQNLDRFGEFVSTIKLTENQKGLMAVGGILLLIAAIKYRKSFGYLLFVLPIVIMPLLLNTSSIDKPYYYNKLASGEAFIYIPDEIGNEQLE